MPVKVVLGQSIYDNADVNENSAWESNAQWRKS